jgi:hypothetical protein
MFNQLLSFELQNSVLLFHVTARPAKLQTYLFCNYPDIPVDIQYNITPRAAVNLLPLR